MEKPRQDRAKDNTMKGLSRRAATIDRTGSSFPNDKAADPPSAKYPKRRYAFGGFVNGFRNTASHPTLGRSLFQKDAQDAVGDNEDDGGDDDEEEDDLEEGSINAGNKRAGNTFIPREIPLSRRQEANGVASDDDDECQYGNGREKAIACKDPGRCSRYLICKCTKEADDNSGSGDDIAESTFRKSTIEGFNSSSPIPAPRNAPPKPSTKAPAQSSSTSAPATSNPKPRPKSRPKTVTKHRSPSEVYADIRTDRHNISVRRQAAARIARLENASNSWEWACSKKRNIRQLQREELEVAIFEYVEAGQFHTSTGRTADGKTGEKYTPFAYMIAAACVWEGRFRSSHDIDDVAKLFPNRETNGLARTMCSVKDRICLWLGPERQLPWVGRKGVPRTDEDEVEEVGEVREEEKVEEEVEEGEHDKEEDKEEEEEGGVSQQKRHGEEEDEEEQDDNEMRPNVGAGKHEGNENDQANANKSTNDNDDVSDAESESTLNARIEAHIAQAVRKELNASRHTSAQPSRVAEEQHGNVSGPKEPTVTEEAESPLPVEPDEAPENAEAEGTHLDDRPVVHSRPFTPRASAPSPTSALVELADTHQVNVEQEPEQEVNVDIKPIPKPEPEQVPKFELPPAADRERTSNNLPHSQAHYIKPEPTTTPSLTPFQTPKPEVHHQLSPVGTITPTSTTATTTPAPVTSSPPRASNPKLTDLESSYLSLKEHRDWLVGAQIMSRSSQAHFNKRATEIRETDREISALLGQAYELGRKGRKKKRKTPVVEKGDEGGVKNSAAKKRKVEDTPAVEGPDGGGGSRGRRVGVLR